jgi:hypothetical protein
MTMKTMNKIILNLVLLSLVTVAKAESWSPNSYADAGELRGEIIQVTEAGFLVDGAFKGLIEGSGVSFVVISGTFFLTGFNKEAVEGQGINVKALPAGTYTYITVLGASRTVKALRYAED